MDSADLPPVFERSATVSQEECNCRQRAAETPDTILIVDDSDLNRAILENIFSDDYAIAEAENGQEGLEKLHALGDHVCAVLLDVVMPVMDGLSVLRQLKEQGRLETLPVFLITAETCGDVIREAYSLGVMDVIHKPVVPYMVKWRVNSVIELFQARRRLSNTVERQQDEIIRQSQEIIRLNIGMIESLSTAIEFRNGESGEHVRRIHDITDYMLRCTPLGEGLSDEDISHIAMASIMHDVGKIAIPDAILGKPGRLTPEEFEIMKTHTVQGAHLLEKIPQMRGHKAFQYAFDIARHHHERWDGRGYPDGLKGDEISIWSQIVSLADVYDALISKRVYKDAYSCDQALEMIRQGQYGTFNPRLLELFFAAEPNIRRLYYPTARQKEEPSHESN